MTSVTAAGRGGGPRSRLPGLPKGRAAELLAQKHGRTVGIPIDVCDPATARPDFRKAAAFFTTFRGLCAGAYYATPAGWQAIGYVGNVTLGSFDGPPPEVLKQLGVKQTVA